MKLKNIICISILLLSTLFFSCPKQESTTTDIDTGIIDENIEEDIEENTIEENIIEEKSELEPSKKIPVTPIIKKKEIAPEVEAEPEVEPVKEEEPKPPVKEEPVVEKSASQEEYERSVADSDDAIDFDTFAEDKRQIQKIIEDLIVIMKDGDSQKWLQYVEKSSIAYWSDSNHLATYSKKLPQKGLRMRTIKDYFKWVFVPSRKGQTIDEIRYISNVNIKAVKVRDDKDIVYYYFRKENGKWKIYLPTL